MTLFLAATCALLANARAASVAPARSLPAEPRMELPVREVTVYSDRARVTRKGEVTLKAGVSRVRLPLLPPTVDLGSVRLEARHATVKRVEVKRADLDEFPRTEAESLTREILKLRDAERALHDQRDGLRAERDFLLALRPSASPLPDPKGQPRLLEPGGWRASVQFLDARAAADEAALRDIEAKERVLGKQIAELSDRARQMASGATGRPGLVVDAVVEGAGGAASLALTYIASGARWYPAYDLRFAPGSSHVDIAFSGLVSQETGEDWDGAALVLSTAVPATTMDLPKLASWKIGEKDRFIPTPVAKPEVQPPRPPAAPPLSAVPKAPTDDEVRAGLLSALEDVSQPPATAESRRWEEADREAARRVQEKDKRKTARPGISGKVAPQPMPVMPPEPPSEVLQRSPAPMAPATMADSAPAPSQRKLFSFSSLSQGEPVPTEALAFSAPRSWQVPTYAADLPAALAGGYDFVFAASRPESIRSGGQARRVSLHAARLPAEPLVVTLPALRKQAYLVVDVANTSDRPLLRGAANLFVGADLQGQATLETTAAGEKVTLPLGVDEAIRVERNVNVVTRETGLISKEDVSAYEVVIEVLNPRAAPARSRVIDQIPLKGDQNVEVKLEKMEPMAVLNKDEGTLEWRVDLPPGAKKTFSFAYSVKRPRGAQLRQW